jgi:hypothetical protein
VALALAVMLNMLRQVVLRLWIRRPFRLNRPSDPGAFFAPSEVFFILNIAGLFMLLWVPIGVLALLPTPRSVDWWVLPMVISGVSYLSGWRSANLGVIVGSVGAVAGLGLFAALDPTVNWWDSAPLFLILNVLGNISGWLGAFIGRGQIREAQCFTRIRIKLHGRGAAMYEVIEDVDQIISSLFVKYWPSVNKVEGTKEILMLAECGDLLSRRGSIVAVKEEVRWIHKYAPVAKGLRWLVEWPIKPRTLNEITTHIFNIWRYATCYMTLRRREEDNDELPDVFHLVIKSYWEIPAIVFVDDQIVSFARELHTTLLRQLKDQKCANRQVVDDQFLVFRAWQLHPLPEQIVLQTWAAKQARNQAIQSMRLSSDVNVPIDLVSDFISSGTFFDRWRGTTATLVFFMLSQVLLGVVVDWFKTLIEQLD